MNVSTRAPYDGRFANLFAVQHADALSPFSRLGFKSYYTEVPINLAEYVQRDG